jgi:Serine acetyltransferase
MINALFFYRISRWLYLHHVPIIPLLIMGLIFFLYNSHIPYQAKIGKGTRLGYGGIGVVIHKDAVIGEKCMIAQHVTVGGGNSRYPGLPIIGNNVHISHGAIVFGGITIGDNVVIGANAVVNKPLPANAIVAGVPAKVLRIKGQER